MKEIKLTQGKFALVDDEDFDELNKFKWYAQGGANSFYARRDISNNGKRYRILMHRKILGLTNPNIHCDHVNNNGLDNQKSNLRGCTVSENLRNSKPFINSTSKYKGVSFYKRDNKWRAQIMIDGKETHLGYFKDEIEAAKVYDKAAKVHHKEFAYKNF